MFLSFLKVTCLNAFKRNFWDRGFVGGADGRRQKANRIIFNTPGKQVVLYNVIIVVYKINCMQKRLNLATHYALRAKTPHPTLQNTPFTLSLSLSFSFSCCRFLSAPKKCITLHLLLFLLIKIHTSSTRPCSRAST